MQHYKATGRLHVNRVFDITLLVHINEWRFHLEDQISCQHRLGMQDGS